MKQIRCTANNLLVHLPILYPALLFKPCNFSLYSKTFYSISQFLDKFAFKVNIVANIGLAGEISGVYNLPTPRRPWWDGEFNQVSLSAGKEIKEIKEKKYDKRRREAKSTLEKLQTRGGPEGECNQYLWIFNLYIPLRKLCLSRSS